jgi:Aminotransferase class I and II
MCLWEGPRLCVRKSP